MQQLSSLVFTQMELKTYVYTKPVQGCLDQLYSELPKLQSSRDVLLRMDK